MGVNNKDAEDAAKWKEHEQEVKDRHRQNDESLRRRIEHHLKQGGTVKPLKLTQMSHEEWSKRTQNKQGRKEV